MYHIVRYNDKLSHPDHTLLSNSDCAEGHARQRARSAGRTTVCAHGGARAQRLNAEGAHFATAPAHRRGRAHPREKALPRRAEGQATSRPPDSAPRPHGRAPHWAGRRWAPATGCRRADAGSLLQAMQQSPRSTGRAPPGSRVHGDGRLPQPPPKEQVHRCGAVASEGCAARSRSRTRRLFSLIGSVIASEIAGKGCLSGNSDQEATCRIPRQENATSS